jgi:tRNA splicing endonuclease
VSAEVKRAEAAATEKIHLWRSASGFEAMSAALKEWQFWMDEKERLLTTQLRPLAQEIVAFYKRQLNEDAERVISSDDDGGDDEQAGVATTSSVATAKRSDVDDLAMSLSEVLSLVERVRANSQDRHSSPSKRRRNLPTKEDEGEHMYAEDRPTP